MLIACNGMEYMDDKNPSRGWAISYSIDDVQMYMGIMDAMADGYITGKDIEDFFKWKKYFDEKGLEFDKILSDEEIEAFHNN